MARSDSLGEFEQSVLLAIAHLGENAYGVLKAERGKHRLVISRVPVSFLAERAAPARTEAAPIA